MIIDLPRFVAAERPYWDELEKPARASKTSLSARMPLAEVQRLHYLYERCSADLSRLDTFSAEPAAARVSGIAGGARLRGDPRNARAFQDPLEERWCWHSRARSAVTWARSALVARDHTAGLRVRLVRDPAGPASKAVLMPFPHLMGSPAERVQQEESAKTDRLKGVKATFSADLMTNNIRVTIMAMAAGITWGAERSSCFSTTA